jgi:sulfide:quinone oxidoreductase
MIPGRSSSASEARTRDPIRVLIAGGGVAALEAALALRKLASDKVRLTILTPAADFIYQPTAVLEPYSHRPPRRLSLAEFAAKVDADLERDAAVSVDVPAGLLHTQERRELPYDALLVATGARTRHTLPGAISLHPSKPDARLNGLTEDIASGSVRSIGFIAPQPAWPLPVYELALLARERADETSGELDITIITAEGRPLDMFGNEVSNAVMELLTGADIRLITGTLVEHAAGRLTAQPGDVDLDFDRVVAVPQLEGPRIDGLPAGPDGFIQITAHCQASGVDRVYVAGDASDFPVKFGAIAAQQADAAAESIAAIAGAPLEPAPFDGVVHGVLFSSRRGSLYFSARLADGSARESRISPTPTWSPAAKIAARYLGPYLEDRWASGPRWLAGQLAWDRTVAALKGDAAAES